MCIKIICGTDTGQVRKRNEDYLGGDESLGLAVLADGMGGYQAGEVASTMAVKTIMEQLYALFKMQPPLKRRANHHYHSVTVLLEQAVHKANQVIYNMAEQQTDYQGMGTTVVAVLFYNNFMSIAHVGDSRLYRLRGNEFRQITKDHSVLQELIDSGFYTPEQARNFAHKNLVTRAVGVGQQVHVDIQEYSVLYPDIYMLCSDGLSDMLDDGDIYNILNSNSNSLEQATQVLIKAANDKGGKDNISLILIRPLPVAPKLQKGWFRSWFGL